MAERAVTANQERGVLRIIMLLRLRTNVANLPCVHAMLLAYPIPMRGA
jgi:hypothetical protein